MSHSCDFLPFYVIFYLTALFCICRHFNFRQNSAVTGEGAISAVNSALTISGSSFSDNTARSGGDAIHACSSEVTVESSDGLSSGNMAGQCLLFDNFPGGSGGVSYYYLL